MHVVWLLPLGGALTSTEIAKGAPREKQPMKTQLCQGQSRHAMTQRVHWRTNRCAVLPSQHPSGIHLLPSQPQLLCLVIWRDQRRAAGLCSSSRVAETRLLRRGLCHHLSGDESVRADTFCRTPPSNRNKSSFWQSSGVCKQAFRQFYLPINSDTILSLIVID